MRPPFLVGCGQLCLFSNQIAGFFDYQYLWKKFSYLLDLLHGDSHQAKLASGTTSFDLVYQLFLLSNQIAGFFDHQYLWKESRYIYSFLHGVSHQGKAASEFNFFGWVWPVMSSPIRLQDSMIINICGRSWLITLIFYTEIIIKEK